jgi:hypothetical protein
MGFFLSFWFQFLQTEKPGRRTHIAAVPLRFKERYREMTYECFGMALLFKKKVFEPLPFLMPEVRIGVAT